MHVLTIADAGFARREADLLARLEAGLAAEGITVSRAAPGPHRAGERAGGSGEGGRALIYQDRGLALTRRLRCGQIVEALGAKAPELDVVHAFGEASWPFAAEIARRTGAALAFEVWCARLTARAAAIRAATASQAGTVLLAPDAAVERALFRQGVGTSVRVAPWGVPVPARAAPIFEENRALAVMVIGSGADRAALGAALEGLARALEPRAEAMVFMDAAAARAAGLWPLIRRLGLAPRLTLSPDMEALRGLTLAGDVLIVPEAIGEHRSLVLEAMAHGLAVIAGADPMVTHLIDRRTGRLVAAPDAGLWGDTISEVLRDAAVARALGASAREYIREEHRVTTQVGLVIDAYEWLASRDSLPLRLRVG